MGSLFSGFLRLAMIFTFWLLFFRLLSFGLNFYFLNLFRSFHAVFRSALFAVFDPLRIERSTNDVVSHAWQVFDSSAA